MQKIFFLIVVLSFLVAAPGVLAQDSELPSPGITPDSPFYFLDTLAEKISLLFTFDTVKKAEKAFQYAGEKLAEVKAMAELNKIEALKKSGQKYQEYLSLFFKKGGKASEEGRDVKELERISKSKSLDYLIILSDTYERIAEEKVKIEIDNLRNTSRKFFGETIWSVHKERMREFGEELKKEEAKKLINEALLKIEEIKLEKAKPEADTHKLQTLIGEVIESGKEATELDPKNPEILFQMGNIYFEISGIVSGAKEWAIHYYKKALELDPNSPLYQEKLREIQSQK